MSSIAWVPVVVAILVFLVGLALQGAAFAYFMGRMREGATATAKIVDALIAKMNALEEERVDHAGERADLAARMSAVERAVARLPEMRDMLIGIGAKLDMHIDQTIASTAAVRMDLSSLQRQLQNLMLGRGGTVAEIHAPHQKG